MTFKQGFSLGIKSYSKAFKFIKKHKLTWYFLFPLVLNIVFFILGYVSTVSLSEKWFQYFTNWMNVDSWDFWGSGFISGAILFLMNLVVRLLFLVFFAYVGGYVIIILMSPVFAIFFLKK